MNQIIPELRHFCWRFSGEDRFIIRKCDSHIQKHFALLGWCVLIVFATCWISAVLFMSYIFDSAGWVSAGAGTLWAGLLANLYFFLLYTISPALLPVAEKGKNSAEDGNRREAKQPPKICLLFRFSTVMRLGLIAFLAIIIALPFDVLFFAPHHEGTNKLASDMRLVLSTKPLAWAFTLLLCCLLLLPAWLKYHIRNIAPERVHKDPEVPGDDQRIRDLRKQLRHPAGHTQLFGELLSIDINTVQTSDFYFQKALIEYRIILEEYRQFKEEYVHILTDRVNAAGLRCDRRLEPYLNRLKQIDPGRHRFFFDEIEQYLWAEKAGIYEYWADPPFRTTGKPPARDGAAQSELLQTLYPDK